MSAFVVEDKVINEVVNYLADPRHYGRFQYHDDLASELMVDANSPKELADLGTSMFQLNCNAVEQRYGQGVAKEFRDLNYNFRRVPVISAIQAYKSLGCWLYQCAEGDVPKTSLLYAAMLKIHGEMAHNIVRSLPGYDAAKW